MSKKLKHLSYQTSYYQDDQPKEGIDQIWIQSFWFRKDQVVRIETCDGLTFTWKVDGLHPIEALLRWWWSV